MDVRIIAATNRDLGNDILKDKFRSDLYYRLNVLRIQLPPLRDYTENLSDIARKMLARIAPDVHDGSFEKIAELLAEFKNYSWPGNLRELENVIRRFAALNSCLTQRITFQDIFEDLSLDHAVPPKGSEAIPEPLERTRPAAKLPDEYERILNAYYHVHCNKSLAAKELGISRSTMWRKLNKLKELLWVLAELKSFRRLATHYGRLDVMFLALIFFPSSLRLSNSVNRP